VVTDIARAMHPTPSALEFAKSMQHDIENGTDGHNPADARTESLKQELFKKYNVDSVDKLPVDFAGLRMQAGEEYGNKVFDKHYNELWATYERQRRVHELASVFAPALAIRSVSMGLSGTDFPQHSHFTKAAEDYRRLINREMNMDLAYNAKGKQVYMAGQELWEKIPDFTYTAPDLSWVLSHLTTSFGMLALWAGVAAIAASVAARKVQVI
jgi:ABC-2 type transport system permease protein